MKFQRVKLGCGGILDAGLLVGSLVAAVGQNISVVLVSSSCASGGLIGSGSSCGGFVGTSSSVSISGGFLGISVVISGSLVDTRRGVLGITIAAVSVLAITSVTVVSQSSVLTISILISSGSVAGVLAGESAGCSADSRVESSIEGGSGTSGEGTNCNGVGHSLSGGTNESSLVVERRGSVQRRRMMKRRGCVDGSMISGSSVSTNSGMGSDSSSSSIARTDRSAHSSGGTMIG